MDLLLILVSNWNTINIVPNLKMNKECMFDNIHDYFIERWLFFKASMSQIFTRIVLQSF